MGTLWKICSTWVIAIWKKILLEVISGTSIWYIIFNYYLDFGYNCVNYIFVLSLSPKLDLNTLNLMCKMKQNSFMTGFSINDIIDGTSVYELFKSFLGFETMCVNPFLYYYSLQKYLLTFKIFVQSDFERIYRCKPCLLFHKLKWI